MHRFLLILALSASVSLGACSHEPAPSPVASVVNPPAPSPATSVLVVPTMPIVESAPPAPVAPDVCVCKSTEPLAAGPEVVKTDSVVAVPHAGVPPAATL